MSSNIELYNEDCLDVMPNIPDNSIDMILCDLPYGTTPLTWDSTINIEILWEQYNRIIKDNGAVVLFGQEPFSSFLRMSNIENYRYDWYWEKERLTNVFQVKKRCGKTVENIVVFYKKQCTYNPQMSKHIGKKVNNKVGTDARWSVTQSGYEQKTKPYNYKDVGIRHPTQVLRFNRENNEEVVHPTQKPVSLLMYLIKTYTDKGNKVLDNCMGSGSTGVACVKTARDFIGIEIDKDYYKIATDRINLAIKNNKRKLV